MDMHAGSDTISSMPAALAGTFSDAASYRVRVALGGRLVIPQPIREDLGIEAGDTVFVRKDHSGIHIMTTEQAVRQAQALVARYIPAEVDLIADLRKMREDDATGR